jgi:hypothetical protein
MSFLAWAAERERVEESEGEVVVSSIDFAEQAGLPLDAEAPDGEQDALESPEILAARAQVARVGVLAQDVPTFWTTAGHGQQRWRWTFTLTRGIRQFRGLASVDQLLDLDDAYWRQVRESRGSNLNIHSGQVPSQVATRCRATPIRSMSC